VCSVGIQRTLRLLRVLWVRGVGSWIVSGPVDLGSISEMYDNIFVRDANAFLPAVRQRSRAAGAGRVHRARGHDACRGARGRAAVGPA